MNRLFQAAFVAFIPTCFVMFAANSASAQFPRTHPKLFGTVSADRLARHPDVQKALAVTDEQSKKIVAIGVGRRGEQQEAFQTAANDFDAFGRANYKINGTNFEKIVGALDEKQQTRFAEIYLQVNSGVVLMEAPIAKKFKVSEEQLKKLDQIMIESRTGMFESMQAQDKTEEDRIKAQGVLVDKREKILLDVLTDDQRKDLEKAKGEELKA